MDLVWVWVTPKWNPQISVLRCKGIYPGSRHVCINWYTLNCAPFKICWVLSCLSSLQTCSGFSSKERCRKHWPRSSWRRHLEATAWVGDEIAYNRRQKRTFASLRSKVQIQLSNLPQPENPVLNTEIYSKWKKLFCIDVNSYVIEFLWGYNCLNICSFPGTILYLPKWSVEKAEWPALPGCASGLIIALFVGIFLLCPMLRTASFPNNYCHYWPGPGYFKELCCWWPLLCEHALHPCLRSQAQQWLCVIVNIRCSLVAAHLCVLDPWSLWGAVLLLDPFPLCSWVWTP